MSRGLWIMGAMGIMGVLLLAFASRTLVSTVGGVEEATALRETVRSAVGGMLAAEPPLHVGRQRTSDGKDWMWRIDLPLREGVRSGDPLLEHALVRIVLRCVETKVGGAALSGTLIRVIEHRGRTVDRRFGPDGNPLRAASSAGVPVKDVAPAVPPPVERKPETGK
jgi:hypothetical protein